MPTHEPTSHPFRARYDGGPCAAECGTRIHFNDMVQYVDGQLVHHGCIPAEQPEPKLRPVCDTCRVEIALNGACSC